MSVTMFEESKSKDKTEHETEIVHIENTPAPVPDNTEESNGALTTSRLSSSSRQQQPTTSIILNDDEEDYVDRSNFYYRSPRHRTWDSSSRSFIPQFSRDQIHHSENQALLKDSATEDTLDNSSLIARSMNTFLNGCTRFSSVVMIICAFSAFVVAILACKRISELRFESFQNEDMKTSHYFLYSLGVIVMLTAGIALSYTPIKSIVTSIRDYTRQQSGYEEI